MTHWYDFTSVRRLCAALAASLLVLTAAPAVAQITVSVTSTPPNGTHYVTGNTITTRISGLPANLTADTANSTPAVTGPGCNNGRGWRCNWMRIDIGGTIRQARISANPYRQTSINYSYTVVAADNDVDGISIPANSITGRNWRRGLNSIFDPVIDRSHAALGAQFDQKVVTGTAALISATSPAALTEDNLDGATVTVTLAGVTFESGVTASSFELVTTMTGVTISSISSVSSGDTSATLTLSSTADISADATLAVRVLAAAHSGSTNLTTSTVSVAFVVLASAAISSTNPASLTEDNLNGATVTVALTNVTFESGVTASSFELVTTMTGVTISSISSVSSGDTSATLTLASTADISADATLAVRVLAAAHSGSSALTTGTVTVVPIAASISSTTPASLTEDNLNGATVAVALTNVTFESGVTTASFELVTTMTGVTISSISSVSSGDTSATLTLASTADISADATLAVRVLAAAHSGSSALTTGTVTVVPIAASISSTTPASLTEDNLNGATVAVALTNVTFESGVTTASFELVTTMTGVTISSISSVSSGDTSATLTLASTADISADATLAVRVLAAAHSGNSALTTGTVTVVPLTVTVGSGVSTDTITLSVDEGATGDWNVMLNSDPGAGCTGGVTIGVASGDAAVTVSPTALTFTTSNWNTAQAVTATAVEDRNIDDETVRVRHAITTGCAGTDYVATLDIADVQVMVDDNDTNVIAIDAPRVREGDVGDMPAMDFAVTLTPSASVQVTVDYQVSFGGTADSGVDFQALPSGTLTFAPGETRKVISVTVIGDAAVENDEGVNLIFSNAAPSTVVIGNSPNVAFGLILDDDSPSLTIDSPRVLEGNTGTTALEFTVTLSPAAAAEVTVDWSDAGDGTATSGTDYAELAGGTLTFAAGETSKTIAVAVRGDGDVEPDETVRVRIANASSTGDVPPIRDANFNVVTEAIGVGTIANDDASTAGTGGLEVAQQPGAVILAAGDEAEIDLSTVFTDPAGGSLTYSAASNDPEVASATVEGSVLRLRAGGRSGTTEVFVTAANQRDQTASVTISVDVVGTESACSTAPAEAPEGGTATAVVELASAAARLTTVRWHLARDTDPATADADAGDHGGASGEIRFRAGERCAEIEIDILDDQDAEPAREWFDVVLRLRFGGAQLARTTIPVAVMEGVCDRTPVLRNALLAATDAASCEAPASAELRQVSALTLAEAGLDTLAAEDFGDLTGLRALDLGGNGLAELPALPALVRLERLLLPGNALEAVPLAALPAPEHLRELILSDNALSELPADAFSAAPGLRSLRLDGNRLNTLPTGLFAGSSSLRLLRLDGNPGAPFTVRVDLERVDAQPSASPPAMLRAVVPLGAPFETVAALTAENAAFADGSVESQTTVAGGETAGTPFAVDSTGGFAHVALTVSALPDRQCLSGPCWQGFALEAGPPLTLFARRVLGDEPAPLFGEDLRVSLSLLAEAGELSGDLEWSVYSSDPSVASVHIAGGHLLVEPALGAEGDLRVEATATDANGQTTTVYFDVRVEFHWPTRSWREIITGEQR